MFSFVVRHLYFLKSIPLLAQFFDSLLRLQMLFLNPRVLEWIDEIEQYVELIPNTTISQHSYGGIQFNVLNKEFGHIHSNGLLDLLLTKYLKSKLLIEGKIVEHHVLKESGWISFYIKNEDDLAYAKKLLLMSYTEKTKGKHVTKQTFGSN